MARLTITLPDDLEAAIRREAEAQIRPISAHIEFLLRKAMAKPEAKP